MMKDQLFMNYVKPGPLTKEDIWNMEETKSNMLKSTTPNHRGVLFRSWLEYKWAQFFEQIGADWEYENYSGEMIGSEINKPLRYLPDFKLHNVCGRCNGDLFIEVKGHMYDYDVKKIKSFVNSKPNPDIGITTTSLLVLGDIPLGDNIKDIIKYMTDFAYNIQEPYPHCFNLETVNGNYLGGFLGLNKDNRVELFGDDPADRARMNEVSTEFAYKFARASGYHVNKRK